MFLDIPEFKFPFPSLDLALGFGAWTLDWNLHSSLSIEGEILHCISFGNSFLLHCYDEKGPQTTNHLARNTVTEKKMASTMYKLCRFVDSFMKRL